MTYQNFNPKQLHKWNKIIVHCSDSELPEHDNVETIRKWHVDERGWSDIGYHFIITKDGKIHLGRSVFQSGAHCKGQNKSAIGICLTGKEYFGVNQQNSLMTLVQDLCHVFGISTRSVYPHSHFNGSKTCPNFELPDFYIGSREERFNEDNKE